MSDLTKENLKDLYYSQSLSSEEIAKRLGVSPHTVRWRMAKYGMRLRSLKDARNNVPLGAGQPAYKRGFAVGSNGYAYKWVGDKNRLVHRVVMESILGRRLKKTEVVHHKNHDRLDNRPENLEVMDRSKHAQLSAQYRWSK